MAAISFTRKQWLTVVVFSIADFCSAICVSLQAPFYPLEAELKGVSPTQYGMVFGVYELTIFIVSPLLGKYLNTLGVKRVFNTGIFTTGTCSVIFGLLDRIEGGDTFFILSFVIRIVEAAGNAGFLTASFSLIAKEFPDCVATMFAFLETFFGLGLIVGPSVGGSLYQLGGYSLPFITMGSTLLAAAVLALFVMPEYTNDRGTEVVGKKGVLEALRIPSVAVASVAVFAASVSIGFLQASLEPHLRRFELSPLMVGVMFVINGGMYAVSAPLWGWACDKHLDPKNVIVAGSVLVTSGFLILGPAPFLPFETLYEVCILGLVLHGIGFGGEVVSAFAEAHKGALEAGFPDSLDTYGLISGLWTSTFALGACVGPTVAGVLLDFCGFRFASLFVIALHAALLLLAGGFVLRSLARARRNKDYNILFGVDQDRKNIDKDSKSTTDSEGYNSADDIQTPTGSPVDDFHDRFSTIRPTVKNPALEEAVTRSGTSSEAWKRPFLPFMGELSPRSPSTSSTPNYILPASPSQCSTPFFTRNREVRCSLGRKVFDHSNVVDSRTYLYSPSQPGNRDEASNEEEKSKKETVKIFPYLSSVP